MNDPKTPNEAPNEDLLLDHRYDGIQEYDNPMPGWWVWSFWGTFFFSVGYLFHFWIGNGVDERAAYEQEMVAVRALAAKQALSQAVSAESLGKVLADATSVQAGSALFAARCSPCHAAQGQGLIGPNLTDNTWVHGHGNLLDIYEVVSNGVLARGMPAWNRQLSPSELRQVVAFVGSIRNTNVAGKAPEGTPVE